MSAPFVLSFQLFLLVFCRVLALVQIAPLLSSTSIPQIAKIGFSFFIATLVFPWVRDNGYVLPDRAVDYFLLLLGEVLIGIIMGFFLQVVFAAFLVAGQLFSLQMGFGASQVFDPMAQIQIPLMGQFLNIMAMFTFLIVSGFQKLMLVGVLKSFQSIQAMDLVTGRDYLFSIFLKSLGGLFQNAMTIAFPILGTLLLVSVTIGLLAKAAPQMNLLMMGFPVAIGVAFTVIFLSLPFIVAAFARIIEEGFQSLVQLLSSLQETGGG